MVECITTIPRENIHCTQISFHKLKNINIEELAKELSLNENISDDLDTLMQEFDKKSKVALDKAAPLKTKSISTRHTNPWFDDQLRQQKRVVRRRERIWRESKTELTWIAFKVEKLRYKRMLKHTCINAVSEQVHECATDSKKLYKLNNNITDSQKENPLPDSNSPEVLAEEFGEYFITKIQKI